jgi:hypothetical protein
MNIFIVGARRSGNTILRDVLATNNKFDCYSEPLRKGEGKSTIHLRKLLKVRAKFLASIGKVGADHRILHFGAPGKPKDEVLSKLPDLHMKYLKFLTQQSEHTLLKLVRVSFTVKKLLKAVPDAKLLHIIRDPRRFVASHIYGIKYGRKLDFFGKPSGNRWSQIKFFNIIAKKHHKYAKYTKARTYMKLLLMWKIINGAIEADGKRFGDNYIKIRHEDLCDSTQGCLSRIYDFIGLQCPQETRNWAKENIRVPRPVENVSDPRWNKAYKLLGITY